MPPPPPPLPVNNTAPPVDPLSRPSVGNPILPSGSCGLPGGAAPGSSSVTGGSQRGHRLGGPGVLLLGLFFAPASEIKKSENQKIKKWSLRNDFRDAAQLRYKSQKWEVKNSLFEGHEVISISVTRQLPGQITEMFRPGNFRFSETFRDSSVLVGQR